jgi:hypothetical protein
MDALKGFFKKSNKKTKKRPSKHSSNKRSSSKHSSSNHKYDYELSGSPTTQLNKVHKNIKKKYKDLGIDEKSINMLSKRVDDLQTVSKNVFTKKRIIAPKSKTRSNSRNKSPILLTVTNLDTGKKDQATVVKNLNTGKYEFVNV